MSQISVKRHIAKTITWRIVGTIDTVIISWLVCDSLEFGLSIGVTELVTKMLLYYFHERIWYSVKVLSGHSRLRHLLKTITWRFIGTIDTVILGWVITGRPDFGLTIGGFELISKMLLYYLHERIWYSSSYGIIDNTKESVYNEQ